MKLWWTNCVMREMLAISSYCTRPIIEGVDGLITELAEHFQLAIVTAPRRGFRSHPCTGRPAKNVTTPNVVLHGFRSQSSCYQNSKPDPQPYLLALSRFGVNPAELIIEDSERGLRSAVAAGIDCAAIYHPFTARQRFAKAGIGSLT